MVQAGRILTRPRSRAGDLSPLGRDKFAERLCLTFIEPRSQIRHFGVKIKLNPVRDLIEGKRVVLIDDSIVRGTTSKKIVKMVRDAGATEVHMRISCPPTIAPCYYGVDTPTKEELIAAQNSIEEIRREIDQMGRDIAGWLAKKGKTARTVTIKVRYSDFTTITRSQSQTPATADADNIAARAVKLLEKTEAGQRAVRLLGVSVHNFGNAGDAAEIADVEARLPFP